MIIIITTSVFHCFLIFLVRTITLNLLLQAQFLEKNNDALHASLEALVQEAQNKFLQGLFAASGESHSARGKLSFISVASKFKSQLQELMDKLGSTVSFVYRMYVQGWTSGSL